MFPYRASPPSAREVSGQSHIRDVSAAMGLFHQHMGGAKIGGSQKWMVYMKNPSRMDDFGVPQSWKPPYCTGVYKITIAYGQSGQSFNHATVEIP